MDIILNFYLKGHTSININIPSKCYRYTNKLHSILNSSQNINIILNKYTFLILKYIDQKSTIKNIFDKVIKKCMNEKDDKSDQLTYEYLLNEFKPVYKKFEMFDLLLLKNKNSLLPLNIYNNHKMDRKLIIKNKK